MINALAHCGLIVRDLERARWFYGTVLGMAEVPRPASFTFAGAWLRSGTSEVHLILARETTAPAGWPDPGPAKRTGLATHLAFEVEDLAAARATLEQHGVTIVGGPMPRGDGVEQLYVQDPDGYLIELFQWTHADQSDAPERRPVAGYPH